MKQITWFDRHLAFQQYVNENYSAKQTRQIISETESGLFRVVLPLMGFAPAIAGRKITKAEKAACFEYMQLLVVEQLPEAEKRFSQALPNLPLTKSSRNTYV